MKKYILIICLFAAYMVRSYVRANDSNDHASEKKAKAESPKHEEHGTHENGEEQEAEHKHSDGEARTPQVVLSLVSTTFNCPVHYPSPIG